MNAVILTSNHLRHKYLVKVVGEAFNLKAVIYEDKGEYYSEQKQQSPLVSQHFERLKVAEASCFADEFSACEEMGAVESIFVPKGKINSVQLVDRISAYDPNVIILFGTGILDHQWIDTFPGKIINLHLGLSPFYRGSATLFWPFYNDELECVGATIHLAELKVDAGAILKWVRPEISNADDYYSINYALIKKAIDLLPSVAKAYLAGEVEPVAQQGLQKGRVYKKSDFSEEVLEKVISKYGEFIPDRAVSNIKESKKCICYQ